MFFYELFAKHESCYVVAPQRSKDYFALLLQLLRLSATIRVIRVIRVLFSCVSCVSWFKK